MYTISPMTTSHAVPSSRRAAVTIISEYVPQKTNLSRQLDAVLASTSRASGVDPGFVRELVWGTIRYLNAIDWIINRFAPKVQHTQPLLQSILRVGVFQLVYAVDTVPGYAALNESVELARVMIKSSRAPGFVNAVLRNVQRARDGGDVFGFPQSLSVIERTAIEQAHPVWLLERWIARYGQKDALHLCKTNNTQPALTIRANTLRITRDELCLRLEKEGVRTEPTRYSSDGLCVHTAVELSTVPSYREGLFIIQDEASQLVARALDVRPDMCCVDLCSGAGIKATHIAQCAQNKAHISAVDSDTRQIKRCGQMVELLGVQGVECILGDACSIKLPLADAVLVDAPCSGTGVIRKKPDIKWNRSKKDITVRLPALQQAMIAHAATLVKPGGVLVYSTCSIEPEENAAVIASFLSAHPTFHLEPIPVDTIPSAGGFGVFLPMVHGTDGFFIARLRRG